MRRLYYILLLLTWHNTSYAQIRPTPQGDSPKLVIYVDQPGAGGDRDPYEITSVVPISVDVGHSWWEFKISSSEVSALPSELQSFVNQPAGYYPQQGVSPFGQTSCAGELHIPDTSHAPEVQRTYIITKAQLEAGLTYTKNLQATPGTYDLNTHNCTDAAIQAGQAAGQNIPDTPGTWPGGGGSNPGDLGEDLRN